MSAVKRAPLSERDDLRSPWKATSSAHEQVAELQRARIVSAMFEVACERGVGNVSVAYVVERSGVSRRTFYEHFVDREDCFQAAFEQALAHARDRVLPAYEAGRTWQERIRGGLAALLSFLDEQPLVGRVLVAESLSGAPKTLKRRAEVIARLTSAVDAGRLEARAQSHSPVTSEGVVGGVLSVIHARLFQPEREPLMGLVNPLMGMIVLPYLGASASRRELERPTPAGNVSPREQTVFMADPFKEAGMRLTYRTVRVLIAISEQPGASNRSIGDIAEIADQGQISKLLGRLERNGMVSNSGLGPGQGAPNAWTLTPSGENVVNSIRAHTEGRTPGGRER